MAWCSRPGGEAWESDAEPTRESRARALQPLGHKDMLQGSFWGGWGVWSSPPPPPSQR